MYHNQLTIYVPLHGYQTMKYQFYLEASATRPPPRALLPSGVLKTTYGIVKYSWSY